MNALQEKYDQLSERIDRLSLRERAFVFVAMLAMLYLIAVSLLWQPLDARAKRLKTAVNAKQQQVKMLHTELQAMGIDTRGNQKKRLVVLEKQLKQMDKALAGKTSGLVSPKEMARLVEDVLRKNRKLQLLSIKSLPPEPMIGSVTGDKTNQRVVNVAADSLIYRHGLQVTLKGRYADIVSYLKQLETTKWKVFWGQIQLSTEKHPVSELTLVMHTLSFEKGWIGT